MKKEKRYWYRKGGLFHAVYPDVKGYRFTTICQIKISAPFTNIVGAIDGKWKEDVARCGNCRRYLKI